MRLLIWLGIPLATTVVAQKVGIDSELGFGCWSAAFTYNYSCPAEYTPYNCHCASNDFLATALTCINFYAPRPEHIDNAYRYIRSQCHYWGNRSLTDIQLQRIYERGLSRLRDSSTLNKAMPVHGTVVIPRDVYRAQRSAGVDAKYRYFLGTIFGISIIGYWALIVLLAMLKRLVELLMSDSGSVTGARSANRFRRLISMPAMFRYKHHVPHRLFSWLALSLPTRAQTIVLAGFIVLNVASLTTLLDLEDNGPIIFANNTDKIIRYLSNRTALISVTYVPIVVLFAARNNPLIYLTGWSYETFQIYHRWSARMMLLHVLVHAITMTVFSFREHVLMFKWHHVFNWRAGNVAAYIIILMVAAALKSIRRRIYEWFLITHQVLFMIFLICLVVHISDYGWLWYLYVAIAFYACEYAFRVIRMVYSGGIQHAEFRLVSENMFRVKITGSRGWRIAAGQYVYIRILRKNLSWQSHPFSIFQSVDGRRTDSVNLVIKAKGGATNEMVQHLSQKPDGVDTCPVIIEGPYGHNKHLERYSSVFLLAGGVGITALYGYIDACSTGIRTNQNLEVLWVVQTPADLVAFSEEVEVLRKLQYVAKIQIYVSRQQSAQSSVMLQAPALSTIVESPSASPPSRTGSVSKKHELVREASVSSEAEDVESTFWWHVADSDKVSRSDLDKIVHHGRPDVRAAIERFIGAASGTAAISSCGPPSFVDQARSSIVDNISKAHGHVKYFEEAFSW